MTILAFMQNQWFKNPERVRRLFARHPQRERIIEALLFAGCKSGRVLKKVFGEALCGTIVWEEASPEIGDRASSVFRADRAHIEAALAKHKPNIVLTFGAVAAGGLALTGYPVERAICGPHPAARQPDVLERLRVMRERLEERMRT